MMADVAAVIVIAGGRSRRFGADKLQHRIGGRTLLERAVDAARACAPVVVVGAGQIPHRVAVAVSEWPRWGGPCAAIAAGVDALAGVAGEVILLSADLVDPEAAVAVLQSAAAGVLADADGRPQWLLARVPLGSLRARIASLRVDRPTLADLPARAVVSVVDARHPVGDRVWADIDTPSDLPLPAADRAKELLHGPV